MELLCEQRDSEQDILINAPEINFTDFSKMLNEIDVESKNEIEKQEKNLDRISKLIKHHETSLEFMEEDVDKSEILVLINKN